MDADSRKLWNAIIEISPVEFGVYDLVKSSMVYSSGLAEKVLGLNFYQLQALSHDFFKDIVHEEDYPMLHEKIGMILNPEHAISGIETTYRIKSKKGPLIWIRTHHRVLERNQKGRPTKLISASEDITELKQLEEKLLAELKKFKSISANNFYALKSQLNAVIVIVKMFNEHHFASEMDERLWQYLKEAILEMDSILYEVLASSRRKN